MTTITQATTRRPMMSPRLLALALLSLLAAAAAGKTTTVEILEGMRAPDSGLARINGIDVQKDPRGVKAVVAQPGRAYGVASYQFRGGGMPLSLGVRAFIR